MTASDRSSQAANRQLPVLLFCFLAAAFAVIAVTQAWSDGPTFDEPVYLSAGAVAITRHDLWMNNEHPPLAKVIAVLPALAAQPVIPHAATRTIADEHNFSARFVTANLRAGRLRRVVFLGRLAPIAEAILIGAACMLLAGATTGAWAGLFAGGLWLASPLTVGLGHLDSIDLAFTLGTMVLAVTLDRYIRMPSRRRAVDVGIACALVLGLRSTGLVIAPLAVLLVAFLGARLRGRPAAIADAAWVSALAMVGLWTLYLVLDPSQIAHPGVAPAPFLSGIARLHAIGSYPDWAFVLGHYHYGTWPAYWAQDLLIKEPASTLAVIVLGLFSWRRTPAGARERLLASCLAPAAALALFTILTPHPIGLRYFLPVIPLLLVAGSPIAPRGTGVTADSAIRWTALGVTLTIGVAASVVSAPSSLSWTEPPFRPAWRVATNSDVDWGQGLWDLVAWSPSHHPWVAYSGPLGIAISDVPGAKLLPPDSRPVDGWVAVSATLIDIAPSGDYTWLRAFCPVGVLAGSILLYRFTSGRPTAASGDPEPGPLVPVPVADPPSAPARLCRSASSHTRSAA